MRSPVDVDGKRTKERITMVRVAHDTLRFSSFYSQVQMASLSRFPPLPPSYVNDSNSDTPEHGSKTQLDLFHHEMDGFFRVLNLTSIKMLWLIKRLRHHHSHELLLKDEHGSASSRALPELTSYQMVALCSDLFRRLLMTLLRRRLWCQESRLLAGSFLRGRRSSSSRVGTGAVVSLVGDLEVRHDCDLEADHNGR